MNATWIGRAAAACGFAMLAGCAQSDAPIALRDMGSFEAAGGGTRTPTRWRR